MYKKYDSSNIKILKGLDAVRKRPGMYIGDTDNGTGLHHMIFEVLDNSIDESLAGYCNKIVITIYKDNSISIYDNGRGIPVDIHKEEGISAVEVIMTILHAGAKFDNNSYKISGGLHGVGISVVNALSEKLELIIYNKNKMYKQIYYNGIPKTSLIFINKTLKNGTYIRFWPNKIIFNKNFIFENNIIKKRLLELSFLNSNIKLIFYNKKKKIKKIYYDNEGIEGFIKYLNKNNNIINKKIFYFCSKKNDISIEIAMQWNDNFKEKIYCFTNNIFQIYGGSHLSGFRSSITRNLNIYIKKEKINKKKKINIIGDDIREGLVSIISVKLSNPKFSSQTKEKLISSEVRHVIESQINEYFMEYLLENPNDSKNIIYKIIETAKIRETTKKIKELSKKKNDLNIMGLPLKLSDCQEKNPSLSEIYLVEGDSAGGSAKQGRNRQNQAILPLKGKILNVEKVNFEKILNSEEILTIINSLGCGIGKNNYNIKKLRYNRIIIMTDADVDGLHIRTLLLTFFYRQIPEIIKLGYVYIAQPPLYKIKKGKKIKYIQNNKSMYDYIFSISLNNITLKIINKNGSIYNIENNELKELIVNYNKLYYIIDNLKHLFSKKILIYLIQQSNLSNLKKLDDVKKWVLNFKKFLNIKNKKKFKLSIKKNIHLNVFEPILCIIKNNKFNKYYKFDYKFLLSKNYLKMCILNNKIKKIKNNVAIIIKIKKQKKIFYKMKNVIQFILKKSLNNISIQRYKGLGEMNPKQLWDTTMNPNKRKMLKINIKNAISADKLFKKLMGDSVKKRKNFIKKNYFLASNIDI
ncbi:DNA gyrase subunit B [Candidatus Annandia adelgestsuga]|uniref:DNA gyrase subunit B n=1 Tax=Candidatus Annandia adelgestsuga TaxID=1302411 RepID=A0A3S5HNW6_9ENTR|nr:DNA gyrase subunit B [Candidatus Annandia adelgestsuga]AZP36238.1 DNA gyrase subunit B [Candidatus Annandia adelgestsuga]